MLQTPTYLFFYATSEIYSNWHPCRFRYDGLVFANSEQAMMYAKAKLMNDKESIIKIKKEPDPYKVKRLGRSIKPWNESLWISKRLSLVSDILYAKFSSNSLLKEQLLATNDLILVEASPSDKIWGIGLDENHPDIHNKKKWKGLNLLGQALMNARENIKKGEKL